MKAALLLLPILLLTGCADAEPIGYGCGYVMAITNYGVVVDIDEPVGVWPDNALLKMDPRPKLHDVVGVVLWRDRVTLSTFVTKAEVASCK